VTYPTACALALSAALPASNISNIFSSANFFDARKVTNGVFP
jgi:hypothetical protein